jgi:hypothetical protein
VEIHINCERIPGSQGIFDLIILILAEILVVTIVEISVVVAAMVDVLLGDLEPYILIDIDLMDKLVTLKHTSRLHTGLGRGIKFVAELIYLVATSSW